MAGAETDRPSGRYGGWAVVTGASDGIGRAFAVELAGRGYGVILAARRRDKLREVAGAVSARGDARTIIADLDLAQPDSVSRLAELSRGMDVGLLVAAAGFGTSGDLIAGSLEDELAMIDVNCRAVAALAHTFGRRFAARGRGGIVLMSSLLAFQGVPRAANYAATKAYVQTLAEGLRAELAPRGVDVIASAPGPIRSGFEARANMRMSMGQAPEIVARTTLAALGRRTTVRPGWLSKSLEASLAPLPRWGRTRAMARVMAGMTRHHAAGPNDAA